MITHLEEHLSPLRRGLFLLLASLSPQGATVQHGHASPRAGPAPRESSFCVDMMTGIWRSSWAAK